jgi:cell pole-organizing protein PopZ
MSEPNVQEPTMEEILASIRRIISEDEPQGESTPAQPAPDVVAEVEAEEVLELTNPLPAPEPEPVVEARRDIEAPAAPEPEPVAFAAGPLDDEPLVSEPTADETASAFGQLTRSIGMPRAGRTLEDLVRELLNPLLKAWLDEHLPAIVQAKVEEEVERIARRRVR